MRSRIGLAAGRLAVRRAAVRGFRIGRFLVDRLCGRGLPGFFLAAGAAGWMALRWAISEAESRRSGIDHDRRHRAGVGKKRGAFGYRGAQAGEHRRERRIRFPGAAAGAVVGLFFLFLGRDALAMRPAHFIVQIGRRGVDRRQASTVPSEGVSQDSGFCVKPLSRIPPL